MKFTALPVEHLEDVTLDLEQLQALLTTPGNQLPFLQLLSAQNLRLALGGPVTISWPGGSGQSNAIVVTHSLGNNPMVVIGQVANTNYIAVGLTSFNATTATFQAYYTTGGAIGAGNLGTLYWIAIG